LIYITKTLKKVFTLIEGLVSREISGPYTKWHWRCLSFKVRTAVRLVLLMTGKCKNEGRVAYWASCRQISWFKDCQWLL